MNSNETDNTLFLYGSAVWAACTVSQEVKAGGIPVSTTEDGDAVSPNIVCVVCEDIGPWLHCFGDSVAVTPTIDALAAEGIRYTSIYGTVGVSAPSRAALITGMYPTHINANYMHTQGGQIARPPAVTGYDIVLPEGIKCYTELLRAAGYYCTNNPKTDYQFLPPLTAWDECGRQAHWRNRPKGMPFSLYSIPLPRMSKRCGKVRKIRFTSLPTMWCCHPIILRTALCAAILLSCTAIFTAWIVLSAR